MKVLKLILKAFRVIFGIILFLIVLIPTLIGMVGFVCMSYSVKLAYGEEDDVDYYTSGPMRGLPKI